MTICGFLLGLNEKRGGGVFFLAGGGGVRKHTLVIYRKIPAHVLSAVFDTHARTCVQEVRISCHSYICFSVPEESRCLRACGFPLQEHKELYFYWVTGNPKNIC